MAESYSQQYRGKVTHVYLGEGKADPPKPEIKKADSLYNKHMQELFDIVAPEAVAERIDAVTTQGELAVTTAELLRDKSTAWNRYKEHKSLKKFISELDIEWRGRELPHKLERFMLFSVMGGFYTGLDFTSDFIADKTFLQKDRTHLGTSKFPIITFDKFDTQGNRKALKAGWEMLTDKLISGFSDKSVKETTNRDDVAFVSPISDALASVGNVISSIFTPSDQKPIHRFINALVNPGSIEAGFRSLSAIPVIGAKVENAYIALNKQLLKGEGLLPYGFDMALTMLAAKETQKKSVELIKDTVT
ncbi:MAG: hypothetical protein AAB542_03755 [Patescibacteria group bacterium]